MLGSFLWQLHWGTWLPPYLPSAHIAVSPRRVGPSHQEQLWGVQSWRGIKRSEKERMQKHRGREGKQVKAIGRSMMSNLIFVPPQESGLLLTGQQLWCSLATGGWRSLHSGPLLTLIVFMSASWNSDLCHPHSPIPDISELCGKNSQFLFHEK